MRSNQLPLFARPPEQEESHSFTTAARLLWLGAGKPEPMEIGPCTPTSCYWCGCPTGGRGRPVSSLAETFPSHSLAAVSVSATLCRPCGWTLSDHVSFPPAYSAARLAMKAEAGRREIVSIRGAEPVRVLLLRLASGKVGLWGIGPNATAEKGWVDAIPTLRETPQDVGQCRWLGEAPIEDLSVGESNKFRAFHHLGTASAWIPCTDSDRAQIRDYLLTPPDAPWVASIGDGKKHTAIYAPVSPGGVHRVQSIYFHGARVDYLPSDLALLIQAWEALSIAGFRDDAIESGRLETPSTLPAVVARRRYGEILAEIRPSPLFSVVKYLRRHAGERSPE